MSIMRYAHNIQISIRHPGMSFPSVCGTMSISTANDMFILTPTALNLMYERSRRQDAARAFNLSRIKKIEEIWLLYYALVGHFPTVESIRLDNGTEINEISLEDIELPTAQALRSRPIITSVEANVICASSNRKAVISAISYLYAAYEAAQEIDRFRFLWSAFNCLYRVYSSGNAEYLLAHKLLEDMERAGILENARRLFDDLPLPADSIWRWNDFLKGFNALSVKNDKQGGLIPNAKSAFVLADADEDTIRELMSRKAYGKWNLIDDESNTMIMRLNAVKSGDKGNRFLFVLAYYLYWLRCDTMHGNSPYPVFLSDREKSVFKTLCDVFEESIVKGLSFIAVNAKLN